MMRDPRKERAFAAIGAWLHRTAGLQVDPGRAYLYESRLRPLLVRFRLADFAALADALGKGGESELADAVVEALTTHETSFFRDRAVFDELERRVLPELAAARRGGVLRLWSAAASTGQEVWTLAIVCARAAVVPPARDYLIVASDIGVDSLRRAAEGVYTNFEVQRGLRARELTEWFRRDERGFVVREELRRRVRFVRHNLLDPPGRLGRFDVVLLRNVLIYMDAATRERVLTNVRQVLAPDGVVVLGASEVLLDAPHFRPLGGVPGLFRPLAGADGQRSGGARPMLVADGAENPTWRPGEWRPS